MAGENPVSDQYNLVYTLAVQPGIKRDGTTFESREFSDGVWCRFQRGVPKKMGGYRELFTTFNGIPRGMVSNAYNGVNYVFVGNQNGIDVFTTGTSLGAGAGPFAAIIEPGYFKMSVASNTTINFVISDPTIDYTAAYPAGTKVIFNGSTTTTYTVSSSSHVGTNTTVVFSPALPGGTTVSTVSIYNTYFKADSRLLWQFDLQYSPLGGALKIIAHPGLNLNNIDNGVTSQVLVGDILPNASQQWTFTGLVDSGGQNPTYKPISVDGGVCVLYPYLFAYGSNGLITNNNVSSTYNQQTLNDWNGATANQVNMSSSKIVKGTPVRGGTNSPSGIFWALDSLIRVSFTGQSPLYWRYDIVSSQISIMSSSSVVEMDGIFYWLGIDRFYQYNGSVSVVPNDKNINWLFDNVNYEQRQKVWATKVPRFNEIWFFYPRGAETECADAIIYNVKDKIWYDAGSATGARRSCGYTTEVLPTPIWASWEYNVTYSQPATIRATPTGQPAPTTSQIYVSGDASSLFGPGSHLTFSRSDITSPIYLVTGSTFVFNSTIGGSGATLITVSKVISPYPSIGNNVYNIFGGYSLWQHEFGTNVVSFTSEAALTSSFTTCDISWVGGTPSGDTPSGPNRRVHLRRIEPDFVQNGELTLDILGRKFARGDTENSGPFAFGPDTGKIDLRNEHRELRLQFTSNTINGDYEMGRLLLTIEYGDERP
jgi:hypothetical protein